jgi:glyoxylase-like metal-dependent hydrolase (beta-lactamase superfamily II)
VSVCIDPAVLSRDLKRELTARTISHILVTHGHFDHVQDVHRVQKKTGAPVGIHPLDAGALSISPDIELIDGETIPFGDCALKVLHTPGHTPGSVSFLTGRYLFAGDTIFPGGPGKTAGPDALRTIMRSIEEKVLVLPADTVIFPGHGEHTTVEKAREDYNLQK